MADVVYSDAVPNAHLQGTLFQGTKFWISQKVPQRSRFVNDVHANGGEVLPIEKHADVKIVDHARKEALPDTHSYTFIEQSVKSGVLQDLSDHAVGPRAGAVRSIGSIVHPAKTTRVKFTQEDDRVLWSWVHEYAQMGGAAEGNKIYQQLEVKHGRHPWQSWRDRWVRHLKDRVPPSTLHHDAPPTPPSDVSPSDVDPPKISAENNHRQPQQRSQDPDDNRVASFQEEHAQLLLDNGDEFINVHPDIARYRWAEWTRRISPALKVRTSDQYLPTLFGSHANVSIEKIERFTATAEQWQAFWEDTVRARYLRRKSKEVKNAASVAEVPEPSSPTNRKESKTGPDSRSPKKPSMAPKESKNLSHNPGSSQTGIASQSQFQKSSEVAAQPAADEVDATALSGNTYGLPPYDAYHSSATSPKRKHTGIEEPLGLGFSQKRRRQSGSDMPHEIPSTPEKAPAPKRGRHYSPLFIEDGDQQDPPVVAENYVDDSPIGREPSESLSEPNRSVQTNKQAVSREPTPFIDFDVPAPEDGWDNCEIKSGPNGRTPPGASSEESLTPTRQFIAGVAEVTSEYAASSHNYGDRVNTIPGPSTYNASKHYQTQPVYPDTQAVLDGKTQVPEFALAEPEGGWDNIPSSPPTLPPDSPTAESDISQSDIAAQIDAWVESHVTQGFTSEQVESVLKCTSMDTELAEIVFTHLKEERGISNDVRGVWTKSDDEDLRATDARRIQRLEEKHGNESLRAREEFLSFYEADD